jgi:hypothetical protein
LRDQTQPGTLPLRPLTTGEVLDAAVVLLRARAGKLIGLGLAFAFAEQIILFFLRRMADLDDRMLPATGALGIYGVLIVVGFGTEAFCIGALGGIAATGAPQALLGPSTPTSRRGRLFSVMLVSLVSAVLCAASAFAFLVFPVPLQVFGLVLAILLTPFFWPFAYGLFGLSAPAVVIDQLNPVRALGRSLVLASRTGLRGVWIRAIGYLAWLLIRLGLSLATLAIISLFYASPSTTVDALLLGGAWLLVNALAYPVLGCLDVAQHLEIRMRTEGLDIALRRSLRRGVAAEAALAVPAKQAT